MKIQTRLLIFVIVALVFSLNVFILSHSSVSEVFKERSTDLNDSDLLNQLSQPNFTRPKVIPVDPASFSDSSSFSYQQESTSPYSPKTQSSLLSSSNLIKKHIDSEDFFKSQRHHLPNFPESSNCKLLSFGIFPEEDSMYFISKPFSCPRPPIDALIKNNTFELPCDQGSASIYVPKAEDNNFIGAGDYPNRWVKTNKAELGSAEFALGKCATRYFAMVRNVYDKRVDDAARIISEDIWKKMGKDVKKMNFNFVMIIVDSMSRQNVFRNLKNTAKYLKTELSSEFVLYDFLINQAEAPTTVQNVTPLLIGERFEKHIKKVGGKHGDLNDLHKFVAEQNKSAVWTEFRKFGFVSMFSVESYSDFVSAGTGRKVLTDHTLGTFWKVSGKELKFVEFSTTAQCIGGKMPHDHTLKYSKDFITNYSNNNRATFAIINTAHEETCTRIKTLDDPLKSFLKWVLEENKAEETFIVLMGDHGRYFKAVTLDSYMEKYLPGHFIIASKSFVDRVGIDRSLKINQDKILTRFDWYETLRFLPQLVYMDKPASLERVREFKSGLVNPATNLFYEIASDDRSCTEMGVELPVCVCKNELFKVEQGGKEFKGLVEDVVKIVNSVIMEKNLGDKCSPLTLKTIEKSESYKVTKDFNQDIRIYSEVEIANKNYQLIISILFDYEKALTQGLNMNKKLTSRTTIIDKINKLHGSKYKVYNVFLNDPSADLGLSDDLNYLCRK